MDDDNRSLVVQGLYNLGKYPHAGLMRYAVREATDRWVVQVGEREELDRLVRTLGLTLEIHNTGKRIYTFGRYGVATQGAEA